MTESFYEKLDEVVEMYKEKINSILHKEYKKGIRDTGLIADLQKAKEVLGGIHMYCDVSEWESINIAMLGFVQGILYSNGVYSTPEFQDHNQFITDEVKNL